MTLSIAGPDDHASIQNQIPQGVEGLMADDFSDIDAAFGGAPASTTTATPRLGMDDIDAAFAKGTTPSRESTVGTVVQAPFVGFNQGLATTFGAPVDVVNWGLKKAGVPVSDVPFGGSESIKRGLGYIGANPDDQQPVGTLEKVLHGAGEGAASFIAPEAALAGAVRAGAATVAPRAFDALQAGFGASKTLPAYLGNAAVGAAAGASGEGAGQVAESLSEKPWVAGGARLAGSLLGGFGAAAGAAGAGYLGRAVADGAGRFTAPLTEAGQARVAASNLRGAASDPYGALNTLDIANEMRAANGKPNAALGEAVAGSKPTTFQLTGDMGLGSAERTAQTLNPEPFLNRRADQNAARVGALEGIQPTGAPEDVSGYLRNQLASLDQRSQALLDRGTDSARQQAAAIGSGETPEALGARLRGNVSDALAQTKAQERALWQAVDPDGTLALPVNGVKQTASEIASSLPQTAKPMAGEEADIFSTIGQMPSVTPFNDLTALRSRVSTAMRDELRQSGSTPTYARLTQLRGSIEDSITNAVEHIAANQQAAVARGALAPEDTIAANIQRWVQDHLANKQQNTIAAGGVGFGGDPVAGYSGSPSASGTAGEAGRSFSGTAGAPRVSQQALEPNFDEAAAGRLAAASDATRERAQTFGQGPVGQALRTNGAQGSFRLPDSSVPGQFFKPGPGGAEAAQAYSRAVAGQPASMNTLYDTAAESLRRNAMTPDGVIDPGRFATWQAKYADALREMPNAMRTQFQSAANASQAVQNAAVMRRAAISDYQQGVFGKLIGQENPTDVVRTVGGIFGSKNAVGEMTRLADTAANNPDAQQGLRRAVADYMMGKFVSNTEAATSGQNLMKSDQFQTFIRQNRPVLERVFTPEEVGLMHNIALDLHQSNRTITAVKLPGQPNTAQDTAAIQKGAHGGNGSLLDALWKGALIGGEGGGMLGSITGAAGAIGSHIANSMRSAGLSKVNDLVREALLDPDLARAMLAKAPVGPSARSPVTLANRLNRLAVYEPTAATPDNSAPGQPVPRAAGGRVVKRDYPAKRMTLQERQAYARCPLN